MSGAAVRRDGESHPVLLVLVLGPVSAGAVRAVIEGEEHSLQMLVVLGIAPV